MQIKGTAGRIKKKVMLSLRRVMKLEKNESFRVELHKFGNVRLTVDTVRHIKLFNV